MKKKKWPRVVTIVVGVVALLGIGGYYAMNMAVDYTLKQIASGIEFELEDVAGLEDEGQPREDEKPDAVKGGDGGAADSQPKGPDDAEDTVAPSPQQNNSVSASQGETAQEGSAAPAPSVPSGGAIASGVAKELQEKVTQKEKVAVASVMMGNFSTNELKQFAEMASNGVSVEEKKAVRDQFLSRLSEEEYNKLIAIAAKYGLSQGKKYDEVKKETGN